MPAQESHPAVLRQPALLAGVALCAFAGLLLELALTRIFSVVLFYHYAYLAISVALLGLGVGSLSAHLRREELRRLDTRQLATRLSLLWCVAVVIALQVVLRVPVRLQLDAGNILRLVIIYLVTAVPFFLTGILLAVVFARNPAHVPRLYGADLCGGALACLATVPLLNHLGGPDTVLFSAAVMALGAVVWSAQWRGRMAGAALLICCVATIAIDNSSPLGKTIYAKHMSRKPYWVEYSRWNAISRIDVVREENGSKWIIIDADAGTRIMHIDPSRWADAARNTDLMKSAPAVSNLLRPQGEFAIIGPGGGLDVLRAAASGSPKVTGIEINQTIVNDVMRGEYADYSYHLYDRPGVDIRVGDGRSFLRNSRDKYDVVQMTVVDTWAATMAGAFAFSENNLYTVEAFKEYFQHLKPDGMIAVTRWEFALPRESLRVVSVAMQALHELGVADPAGNLIVISEGDPSMNGRPVLVLGKLRAFTAGELSLVSRHLRGLPRLVAQYLPGHAADNAFARLIHSNDPVGFARDYVCNVAPVYDNDPFFFFTLRLGQVLGRSVDKSLDWKVNIGVIVLGMALLLSLVAILAFLVIPLAIGTRGHRPRVLPAAYFMAIGFGYIVIEIAFIQRFVLFLGHPTYALAVVIFLMLLSSGAGSLSSRRWLKRTVLAAWPLLAIVIVLLGYIFLLPALLPLLVGWPMAAKLFVSGILLGPLGFAMGMPFPAGLRAVGSVPSAGLPIHGQGNEDSVEWAMTMNTAAGVLGSSAAVAIAIRFGLNVTLACGAAAYAIAGMLIWTLDAGVPSNASCNR